MYLSFIGPAYLELFYIMKVVDNIAVYIPKTEDPKITWDSIETLYMEVESNRARYVRGYARAPIGEPERTKARFVNRGRDAADALGIKWSDVYPPKEKPKTGDKGEKRKADDNNVLAGDAKRQKTAETNTEDPPAPSLKLTPAEILEMEDIATAAEENHGEEPADGDE